MPQRYAQARQQLFDAKGLGEVVVGAGVQSQHLVGLAFARG